MKKFYRQHRVFFYKVRRVVEYVKLASKVLVCITCALLAYVSLCMWLCI